MDTKTIAENIKSQVETEIRSTLHDFSGDASTKMLTAVWLDLDEWQAILKVLGEEVSLKRSDHEIDEPIT